MKYIFLSLSTFLILSILLIGSCSSRPRTVDNQDPYEITVNGTEMKLLDMGYVNGSIQNKKIHCYYIAFGDGFTISPNMDHIYVLEDSLSVNSSPVNIEQRKGKSTQKISLIVGNDTFELK